jgi:light-regulated signal transduction histidine kinase (bacteriophytochrome)
LSTNTTGSEETKAAVEEIERLVYAVSHDLRQPLRSILSYAELLRRQCALDQGAMEMTGFIVDAANEMKALIEDLLTYSRIKTSPERTVVSLNSVVQPVLLKMQNTIRDAGAQITCVDLPEAAVDEAQFGQLFEQLFTNAIRFRSADPPRIDVSAEEEPEGYLVRVRDNARGIEPKYHEDIFVPFKRLHGREVPGTGLGLALCRKIVRAHGGKIWVESEGSQGSVFKFTVPF